MSCGAGRHHRVGFDRPFVPQVLPAWNDPVDEGAVVLVDIERCQPLRFGRSRWDWLQARASEHGVKFREPPAPKEKTKDPIDEDDTARALDLCRRQTCGRSAAQQAVAMIAAARGYHSARTNYLVGPLSVDGVSVDEWADTSGSFIIERAEVERIGALQGRQKKLRRRLRPVGHVESGNFDSKNMSAIACAACAALLEVATQWTGVQQRQDRRG